MSAQKENKIKKQKKKEGKNYGKN